jgi:hypothetical protein
MRHSKAIYFVSQQAFWCKLIPSAEMLRTHTSSFNCAGALDKQKSLPPLLLFLGAALFMMALILRRPLLLPCNKSREQRTEAQVYSLAGSVRAACSLNQSTQTFNDFALLWHSLINSRIQAAAKG